MAERQCSIGDFRRIDKEIECVYHGLIRRSGISLSEFWILVMVREGVTGQKAIAGELFWSKQTVHSACAKLVERGLVELAAGATDRREKVITLTERGREFCRIHFDKVESAEERAWRGFLPEERRQLVELLERYCRLLREFTADE